MMTNPNLDKVWRGERGMRVGIRACENAKCVVSALTLIYSAVDALAALTRKATGTRATRKEFLDWVEAYLIPELGGDISPLDVYGARCGVVHTYGPNSDLSNSGAAKVIIYKWRTGHRPDDPILAQRAKSATVIEIENLIEALDRAVNNFEVHIENDKELRGRVEQNVAELLCYEPWRPVVIYVAA